MSNKRSLLENGKIIFLASFSIVILFLSFHLNLLQTADQQWFDNFQYDMESYIVGRIVKSHQDGVFSDGGLTGIGSLTTTPVTWGDVPFANQYLAYTDGLRFGAFTTYDSQIGGQGILFSVLDGIIHLPPQEKLILFHALTSLCSAIVLAAIIVWFYLESGLTVSLFVLASAVFSQWLVVFGRILWWSMWAFYLPIAVMMYYHRRRPPCASSSYPTFGVVVFITVFIKCFFNGYEYITSFLVMMIVPFLYYSIRNRISIRKCLPGLSVVVGSSIFAVLLSSFILCFQISSVKGNFLDGVNHIIYSFEKRSYPNPSDYPDDLAPNLESNVLEVVVTYLKGTFFDANRFLSSSSVIVTKYVLRISYLHLSALFVIMSGILLFLMKKIVDEKEKRRCLAFFWATWFSILAPVSWFVIFKAHSAIHTHMNFIVWQMPFTFFGFTICGLVVKNSLTNLLPFLRRFTGRKSASLLSAR
jgi:hypothetical protein